MTLPEIIAGCHGDEEPEVYADKTAFVSKILFAFYSEPGADETRSAPKLSGMLTF